MCACHARGAAICCARRREVVRSFRLRIVAERDRIEVSRRLPEDLGRELAHAGFCRIFLPETYGGLDLTPTEALEVFEELVRADASVVTAYARPSTHIGQILES